MTDFASSTMFELLTILSFPEAGMTKLFVVCFELMDPVSSSHMPKIEALASQLKDFRDVGVSWDQIIKVFGREIVHGQC
jgi:hypothetical protein